MVELKQIGEALAEWVESGSNDPIDLQHAELDAPVLRALLMSLPVKFANQVEPRVVQVFGAGIRLRNAVVSGTIDLRDGRSANGASLPPLIMERCCIKNPILLARARIQHLSLKGSRITHLDARGVHVEESLDITELASAEDHQEPTGAFGKGLCWVDLQESQIDGMLDADKAVFVAPPAREEEALSTAPVRHALNLKHAQVRDSIFLFSNVCAVGGVSLVGARIGGDVQCSGAEFVAVEGAALTAVGVEIGGHLLLRAQSERRHGGRMVRFHAEGPIELTKARIGRELSMLGAQLDDTLNAEDIDVGASVFLKARPQTGGEPALPFEAASAVNLLRAKIGGDLELNGAVVKGGLNVENAEIIGNVRLCDYIDDHTSADSRFTARRAEFSIRQYLFDLIKLPFLLPFRFVSYLLGRDPELIAKPYMKNISVLPFDPGEIASFANAHVHGTLYVDLDETKLRHKGRRAMLDFQCMRVSALDDRDGDAFGNRFQLRLHGFEYEQFKFDDNTYSNQLQYNGSIFYNVRLIELFCAAILVYVICGFFFTHHLAWSLLLFSLALFLLTDYLERWYHGRAATCRIRWLGLQYEKPTRPKHWEYTPEPYENLARVFRAAGFFVDARRVASRRYQLDSTLVTPLIYQPFTRAFGFFFDYGLSPPFAIMTFVGCLGLGWFGASLESHGAHFASRTIAWSIADHQLPVSITMPAVDITPVLVITTNTVNSVAARATNGGDIVPGVLTAPQGTVEMREIACGNQIDPLLYAVDLFVPAMDLGQQQRCQVSATPETRVWRIINSLYVGLGWIVTALTILTVSGIMRKQAEE